MKPPTRLVTIPELAARLRVSKRSAYRIAREMTHATIASRLLVTEDAVERYIESKLRTPEAFNTSTRFRSSSARTRTRVATTATTTPSNSMKPIEVRTKPRKAP